MRIVEGTKVKAGGEKPPEDYGHEGMMSPADREMIVNALKMAIIPEITSAAETYFERNPVKAPKPPKGAIWIASVVGALIFVGTMLVATLWSVSSLSIAAANQKQLYTIYTEQTKELYRFHFEATKEKLADMTTQNAVTRAYVIDVRTALASQGIQDPLHEP